MSFKDRPLVLIENDNTIYRLLLSGLLIASPALHYLCFYNSYDPIWLRAVVCAFCAAALGLSFTKNTSIYQAGIYAAILSYLVINNCLLLGINGFEHVYLFSSITIFIALTLFCKKRWEFVILSLLNLVAVLTAYYTAPRLYISSAVLVVLLALFTIIAYVSFLVVAAYQRQFKKAVDDIMQLNQTLLVKSDNLRDSQHQLNALISSVNDTIFELDENGICLNVWFGPNSPNYLQADNFMGKTLAQVVGYDKAQPFIHVYEQVIKYKTPASLEFPSLFDQPTWFIAKAAPILDLNGNYTKRISVAVTDITEQKKRADILKANESLLLQAQHIAKTGNWWFDTETREDFWSDSLHTILEIEEVPVGLSKFEYYMSLVHPDDRENVQQYLKNVNLISANSLEHKFITPTGKLRYLKILRGELVRNADGNLKRVVGIIQDVTDSKLNEKAVKISQAELLEAQTIAKIGNWKWDSAQKVLSWSDEVNSIYEIPNNPTSSARFGRQLLNYTHPDDKYIVKHLFENAQKSADTSYEYRIITPNGNLKYICVTPGKLMYRDDGTVRKIIGTLQDITQRKQAEIDYKRTENKYRLVLETVKLAAISLDASGKVIFCNRYLANLLGYSQMEILGMDWMKNFMAAEHQEVMRAWFRTNSVKAHYVNPIICRNGDQRIISWQNTASYDENGNIKETTGIGEDITVQQKVRQELISAKEEAERSSHFKSEFLSIMSHEIRTPMNAVIGTTNLLIDENPRPEQLEYLNTLKFSGENLLAIINDILDYNKIEAGKLQLSQAPFNIHQLVQNIRQSFYAKALEKKLDIELITDAAIPEHLIGDANRLGQILINLVGNAVKFTMKGKVSIIIETEPTGDGDIKIRFTVADTGIGIAAENLAVVFDPFIQEPQVVSGNFGGTGLGLAITKRLIELHQSTIQVTSTLGKGTKFTFSILFKTDKQLIGPANNTTIAQPQSLSGMNILVVDDNHMNLLIAAKFLERWQANVDQAVNGQIAVNMVKIKHYDMIIMDLQMPVMNGFEASAIIKKNYPDVPILAFTADAMPETHQKAFMSGMCDYLTKPFIPDALFEKIYKHRKTVKG
jgi:two-component system sensor histidine kinase/response regulator